MHDLLLEPKISRREAAELLGCTPDTVTDYMLIGVPGGLKLEHYKRGQAFITSREAVRRFLEAQTPDLAPPAPDPSAPGRQKRNRKQRVAAALESLRAEGMKV